MQRRIRRKRRDRNIASAKGNGIGAFTYIRYAISECDIASGDRIADDKGRGLKWLRWCDREIWLWYMGLRYGYMILIWIVIKGWCDNGVMMRLRYRIGGLDRGNASGKRNSGMWTMRFAIAISHQRVFIVETKQRGRRILRLWFAISHRRRFKWCYIASEEVKWSDEGSY